MSHMSVVSTKSPVDAPAISSINMGKKPAWKKVTVEIEFWSNQNIPKIEFSMTFDVIRKILSKNSKWSWFQKYNGLIRFIK